MLKSVNWFFKKNYLIIEAIEYTDRTLFRRIVNEEFTPTEKELADLDIELSNPETAKKYLDNEEEIALIKQYKADPTGEAGLDARNKVIENKLKWIYLLANKAANAGAIKHTNIQDAVQNAVLFLIRAIDKYDPSKNVPFTAYCKSWIIAGIKNPYNIERQKSISADTQNQYTLPYQCQSMVLFGTSGKQFSTQAFQLNLQISLLQQERITS